MAGFSGLINVTDCWASGDYDMTAAIQRAVNVAMAGGGGEGVYFPDLSSRTTTASQPAANQLRARQEIGDSV